MMVHKGVLLHSLSLLYSFSSVSALSQTHCKNSERKNVASRGDFLKVITRISLAGSAAVVLGSPAFADEIGRETEAPTLPTGETVMICTKRGPLGACTKEIRRTEQNDNDKANKYFKDPGDRIKKETVLLEEEAEGNALIRKLRQQTADNREKNELFVQTKTLINDEGANFGPFSRQVVILNTDGKTFTLLENPQAMRLKKAGFIEDRKFIKQPTEQELLDALPPPSDGPGALLNSIFGGSDLPDLKD